MEDDRTYYATPRRGAKARGRARARRGGAAPASRTGQAARKPGDKLAALTLGPLAPYVRPASTHVATIAQLVRAPVCGTGGRGFKSRWSPHSLAKTQDRTDLMDSLWDFPDFDEHELVHFVTDRATGLKAVIAVHSTHLGPGAGGTRFWHYAEPGDARRRRAAAVARDELQECDGRAAAGRRQGGDPRRRGARPRRPRCSPPSAARSTASAGAMSPPRMSASTSPTWSRSRKQTRYVAGLPVAEGAVGGDPGPHTSYGVFLGVKAAVKRKLGKDSLAGLHIAIQGAGSVASRPRPPRRRRGRAAQHRRHRSRPAPQALADEVGGTVVAHRRDHDPRGRRAQPQRARRDPDRSVDRGAQRADRRRRRQQPARHAAPTATASTRAASSTRPIT